MGSRLTDEFTAALARTRAALLLELDDDVGRWQGELCASALSTAVAVFALAQVEPGGHARLVKRGLEWIAAHANADGGWGDTVDSPSNISATVLCWAALSLAGQDDAHCARAVTGAERWIVEQAGDVSPARVAAAIVRHYDDDRTFSTPILVMCALAGRLGPERDAWREIVQLPFELAVLPPVLFRWLRLMVVSYAMPALIAMGLLRHRRLPSGFYPLRRLRELVAGRALAIARGMQPVNGGYEEAVPLTGFVCMALAAAGERDDQAVVKGVSFLAQSARPDGSWPIDTNLATWLTVLGVNALTVDGLQPAGLGRETSRKIRDWLLDQQHNRPHPLTYGGRGGWAWTDLPGGMPDADDTAGALVTLRRLGPIDERTRAAALSGAAWLLALQNPDGGIPTFCRGWGRLPFDRSCPDITAHALRALVEWRADLTPGLRGRADRAVRRGIRYLCRTQRPDGAWIPLWFGNQHTPGMQNPTYGTAQVICALRRMAALGYGEVRDALDRGCDWLAAAQNEDGSWGGDRQTLPSLEETGLAVMALAGIRQAPARRGAAWLADTTGGGWRFESAPIGLYFAKLWYSERLYPMIFALWGLGAACAPAVDECRDTEPKT